MDEVHRMKTLTISLTIFFNLFSNLAFADLSGRVHENHALTLGTWASTPLSTPNKDGLLDELMQTAFKRCCNISVTLKTLPAERSLKNANLGRIDGELPRIANISGSKSNYPNLLQVNESLLPTTFVAFTKNSNINIHQWNKLKDYRVGIVRGWKILERKITKYRTLEKVKNGKNLFNMLDKGRVDVVIFNRLVGLTIIEQMGLKGIYGANSPIFSTKKDKWFLYMHKKHKALVPKLEKALYEMKANGSYAKIYCKRLKEYLPDKDMDMIVTNALQYIGASKKRRCSDIANHL